VCTAHFEHTPECIHPEIEFSIRLLSNLFQVYWGKCLLRRNRNRERTEFPHFQEISIDRPKHLNIIVLEMF